MIRVGFRVICFWGCLRVRVMIILEGYGLVLRVGLGVFMFLGV